MNLKQRIEKLEAVATPEDGLIAVFFEIVGTGEYKPIIGWKHKDNSIMALPGETQEELKARAKSLNTLAVSFFSSIYASDS